METKQDKLFNAILAKNKIARELRNLKYNQEPILSFNLLESCLQDIEEYLGQANQPSVEDIINDKKGWL